MDIRDLRYFIAAAELGQLHRAADRIGRSQPALSKSIAKLEAELGARLFHRSGRGITLTSVGATLLQHARRLSQGMQEALRDTAQTARGETGHVRLGCSPTMADWVLPGVIATLVADAPELTVSVTIGLGETLRKGLRDGLLDLALAPITVGDQPEFAVEPVSHDTLVVAARPGHPLAARRRLTPTDLHGQKWMMPGEALASTVWLRQTLVARGLPEPQVQVEVNAKTMLRRALARTDLLTFLSRRDLEGDPQGRLCELQCPDLVMHRQFGLLRDASGYLPAAAARLAALVPRAATDSGITKGDRTRTRRNLPSSETAARSGELP